MAEGATGVPDGWVTTSEAAARLGVKRATLYAYVSRGVLRSQRRPGQQESLFERAQIDALAGHTRQPGTPQPLLRFRSVATAVSSHRDGELRYRGMPVEQVCAELTLGEAAELLLGAAGRSREAAPERGPDPAQSARMPGEVRRVVAELPLERRVPVAVALLGAQDPLRDDRDPDRVRSATFVLLDEVLVVLDAAAEGPADGSPPAAGIAAQLFHALARRRPTRRELECLSVLVIALMDHGLTASTIAARVAASTRSSVTDCLVAAYATMAGPLHGGAPIAAHQLLARAMSGDPAEVVGQLLRAAEAASGTAPASGAAPVPGFGHVLYTEEDPRAAVVFERLWRVRGTARLRRATEGLIDVMARRLGTFPNVDLATAAAVHAFGMPAGAGEVVFQTARTVGLVAHVLEEYAEEPLRWRGRVLDA
ncbi:MAG TPA: citrate/2-methylcitrate synthase [Segeticoccus sp.]|uniref:citrate/2-methylcitrate synthase n=1 Tax=Segeticoccus sp. TaxID=2706531 RepID=UPI002D7FC6CA|nr:citrate/2-methylcitrate synthase [Segeticoccus sp.]HET8600187.1 citrate/2-methylcitrate synthase [Segeticoccus sp.]